MSGGATALSGTTNNFLGEHILADISKGVKGALNSISDIATNGPTEAKVLLGGAAATVVGPLAVAATPSAIPAIVDTYQWGMVAAGAPTAQTILKYSYETIDAFMPGPPSPTIPEKIKGDRLLFEVIRCPGYQWNNLQKGGN